MKKAVMIADSGGTKTDWCFYDDLGNTNFFETDSYHPHLISSEWIASKKVFWKVYADEYELEVHFYGSGCVNPKNRALLKKAFESWGIHNLTIQSDILGAAKACFGDKDGVIGILGTGSVFAVIENNSVGKIVGGLGYILGDEGSGYYFGKLTLQGYLKNLFSTETNNEIHAVLGDRDTIFNAVYSSIGKKYTADLAEVFSTLEIAELNKLHEENIRLFLDIYLPEIKVGKTISFIGSYAYYNRKLLRSLLAEKGWELEEIVKKPMLKLSEYHKKRPF